MMPHSAAAAPAIGRHIQKPAEMRGEQREDIGADGVEGDIAEVEQAGEADHDVEAPAEHHIGQHEDRQVEQIAERQAEMERLLQEVGREREEDCEQDAGDGEDARVREVGEEKDDHAADDADGEEPEHRGQRPADRPARRMIAATMSTSTAAPATLLSTTTSRRSKRSRVNSLANGVVMG